MDISEFKEATFEEAKDLVLSKGLKSLKKDDNDFFCDILISGCIDRNEKVELLLSAGVDVNAPTDGLAYGFTPLASVIKKSKEPVELIDLLLNNGAHIEAPSQLGLTPLHCAIIIQNLGLLRYLISKGANPNAVYKDDASCLMLALLSNNDSHNRELHWPFIDIGGRTKKPVDIEIMDELVRSGAKLDHEDRWGKSVLDVAISTRDVSIVDWLFQNGIKPNDTVSARSSTTLLMSASSRSSITIVNHLLALGATVDAVDQDEQTALFYAGNTSTANALIGAGANLIHLDKNGRSLFQKGYVEVGIFQKYGAEFVRLGGDIQGKDKDGRNILHHLLCYDDVRHSAATELAMSLDCEVNARDKDGKTPFMSARSKYWELLIAAGARINDVDNNGDHALNLQLSEDLLDYGADINWANKRGQTPLMLAAQQGDISLIRKLLKAGADIEAVDQEGKMVTDYANANALAALVKAGAPLNQESNSALTTAIVGKNANLSKHLLKAGLKARLSDYQVTYHLALLENIAQENLDLFRFGILGDGEKADKLIAKIIAAGDKVVELAKARPVCDDEDLPEVLRPGKWPRKVEAPTPHIKTAMPLKDSQIPSFNPPEGFEQRMRDLHDQILAEISDWSKSEKKEHKKSSEKDILKICKKHKSRRGPLSSWEIYSNRLDFDGLLICSDSIILQLWNDCYEIFGDLIHSYSKKLFNKSKFDLALYRLKDAAFQGIKQGHGFAIHCLAYFDAFELAPVMAREIGRLPAQTWLKRFSDTAVPGLLACAFSDVPSDRSEAQQALRWLATRGYKDRIKHSANSFGAEAHAAAETFLDRCDGADFLPKKLPKLPAYFVASAHPAPILKGIGKALPTHAVETLSRMMLVSTCSLKTPSLAKVIEACDPQSLADFAFSAYDSWVKNGAKKEGVGFLHALAYLGGAPASALLIKSYRNAPFYPATVAAIEALGALGTNAAISGLLRIMRFSQYDKAQAYAQEMLEGVADSRGLTTEQLEDLAIPDLGLNGDGQMHLDFGPRQFTAAITANLDVVLTDNLGRLIKALPKATKSDDARLAKLATAQWKEFKAGQKSVSKDQLKRFEQAMIEARRWDGATFKEVITVHPLLSKMVRNLVWAVVGDDINELKSFRINADGQYLSANEDVVALPDNASIILPHPLLLDHEIPLWLATFAQEKLSQPILQLARKWFVKGTRTDELLDDKSGTKVPLGALKGLKSKGWWFEEGGAGMVWSVNKSSDGARGSIDVEPGWSMSGFGYDDFGGGQTIKLDASGDDAIAYSELVRELLSLPMVDE